MTDIQAEIMVARRDQLNWMWQRRKPIGKIDDCFDFTGTRDVARVHKNVAIGDRVRAVVAVRVGGGDDSQEVFFR